MPYNYVYLPFSLCRNVNYIYLLCLYSVAEKVDQSRIKSDIDFNSFADLERKINAKLSFYQKKEETGKCKTMVSASTLSRIVKKDEYKHFFIYKQCGANKTIVLNNDFSRITQGKQCSAFVRLSPAMVQILLETQDNLLAQYLIYLVHYCSISGNKTDFTIKQFLSAAGYSTTAKNYISKISEYNTLLQQRGIIKIKSWRDEQGKMRNTYSLQNYAFSVPKVVLRESPEGDDPKSNFVSQWFEKPLS